MAKGVNRTQSQKEYDGNRNVSRRILSNAKEVEVRSTNTQRRR
jgi:hypothetical protein